MGRVAIVTDSNSGITQKEAKELGIRVLRQLIRQMPPIAHHSSLKRIGIRPHLQHVNVMIRLQNHGVQILQMCSSLGKLPEGILREIRVDEEFTLGSMKIYTEGRHAVYR